MYPGSSLFAESTARSVLPAAAPPRSVISLPTVQAAAFRTLAGFQQGRIGEIYRIWKEQDPWPGVILSESDYATLALELAIRLPAESESILLEQRGRIQNPDRLAEFDFVAPAVSARKEVRDEVFQALLRAEHRRHEPWAESALAYLNHPLRQKEALGYIRPALEALQEVQRTGDIFFPKKWVAATLRGHDSPEAYAQVEAFLAAHPDYPQLLRNKILQASAHGRRHGLSEGK